MTRKTKLFTRALVDHCRLRIKYVNDLPPNVSGFLDPSKASRTIVLNANKSKCDHVFTIFHEIAHYVLHFQRSHQMRLPWWLTRKWKSKPMIRFKKTTKLIAFRKFNEERQADLWAFCMLFQIGATDDILGIVDQYPEKTTIFWLSVVGSIYSGVKSRLKSVLRPISRLYRLS
jgi:hypothetical protein